MSENRHFLQALLKNPLGVGAVTPSSKELAALMVADIAPKSDAVILELGIGTGAITKAISRILPDNESYFGIEIDKKLSEIVRLKFPDLIVINGDACSAVNLHKETGLGRVSFVLSGIPFVSLPKEACSKIFTEIDHFMALGCLFRTFQYVHGFYTPPAKRFRLHMTERYGEMKKSPVVFKNIPPAVTLTWQT